jgi:hypothetical protein
MGNDEEERLTLSPEDLYELAWSRPISELREGLWNIRCRAR